MDPKVVDKVIEIMEQEFGKIFVKRGNEHDFLGIKITYTKDGLVKYDMKEYLLKALELFSDKDLKQVTTPARNDLFELDVKSPKVSKTKREIFHSTVMLFHYASYRGRRDLQLTNSALASRVLDTNKNDYVKLRRLMRYVKGILYLACYLGASSLNSMISYIDASHAVNPDCRSHTGVATLFRISVTSSQSTKQKLNAKSSTESELLGVLDRVPSLQHHTLFMEAQGYPLENNTIYQGNKSAMLLEKNGRISCSKKTRHLNIIYFYIKDLIDKKVFNVENCPTEIILADLFTKPLQGSLFVKFRDVILG